MARYGRRTGARKVKLYKQPSLKPDGMYKEKIKFMVDIFVQKPDEGANAEAWLNIHHTYPLQATTGGPVNGNIHFNADNT